MDRATLNELRDHHLAFLRRWLGGWDDDGPVDGARQAWVTHGCAAIERARALPVERIVPRAELDRVVEAALGEAAAAGVIRPLAGLVTSEIAKQTAAVELSAGELIGAEAREALETLAERPDVIDEAMVRAITREPAMEAVMRDVLFDALVAFNASTNPFVAPWGVPALLDAVPRVGRGAIRKTFDTVRGEFERRLQPEMRRFLEGFARKSLDDMIDTFVHKADDPQVVAMRRHAVTILLDTPLSELGWSVGDPRHEALRRAIEAAVAQAMTHPRTRALVAAVADDWQERFGARALGEVLDELGVTLPDPQPFVAAAWPAVQAALLDDAVFELVGQLIDASHDEWLAGR